MIALLALHAALGTAVVAVGGRLGRRATALAVVAPAVTLVWLLAHLPGVLRGTPIVAHVSWMPRLGLDLDLRLDRLSAVMVLLASGLGVAVFAYAASYLPARGPGVGRLLGLLTLFGGAMVGLVLSDNLLVLYGFWELTSVTSFLLIGNDHDRREARAAALHALLVTSAGGLAMLGGFLLLGHEAGTYRLSEIVDRPPTGGTVGAALALVLLGAFTKSAQYPFHAWLPGAMVAPTPVSAYLHAATMVKAGVYLIARLSPAFADPIGWWRPVVIGVGVFTMIAGGLRALGRHDLKLLLAHGTVSQLGFLVAVFGIGSRKAVAAGTVLLLAHGAFKATAFFAVGIVDHQFGTRDLRHLPRLDRSSGPAWLATAVVTVVAGASMAGVPFAFGFIAKEADLQAFLDGVPLALPAVALGSMLTAAYSARFAWGLLGRDATVPAVVAPASVAPGPGLLGPALALTAVTLVGGLWPATFDDLAGIHLALWHGPTLVLGLSGLVLAGGTALFAARHRVARALTAAGARLPDAADAYLGVLRGLNAVADRVTAISQPGSLPVYAGVILFTAAVVPLWALSTGPGWPGWPDLVDTPAHLPVVALLLSAAVAASLVRRRFSAALFLGVAGYAMAALFVVQGAPDLALTQVAIETLSTVLFVLVLRRLPDRFGWTTEGESGMTGAQRGLRMAVAATVGASVFVLAITMSGPHPATPLSDEMIERALPDGGGRNVVNVILVDFRGLDTLGEITVLVSAAIGAVALARAGRRPGSTEGAPTLRPLARMVTLDVSVRIVFAAVMVGSVYLLFAGHNQPGGGFVGGILAGAAVSLHYLAGGIGNVRRLSRARPWTVLGSGLLLSAATAAAPLLWGRAVLTAASVKLHPPLIGSVKLSTPAAFDVGVYLVVLGLALMVFESFGDDPPPADHRPGRDHRSGRAAEEVPR